jgi:hypothetical protein
LLADNYVGLKDNFQAKATLQSIIDNYKADDDILPTAKQKLEKKKKTSNELKIHLYTAYL